MRFINFTKETTSKNGSTRKIEAAGQRADGTVFAVLCP